MRKFNTAPLPFQGQKRRWVKAFSRIVKETKGSVFVDLFGGSGLLSHLTKSELPNAKVIWNDHDDYRIRLNNVAKTNALLGDLKEILKDTTRKDKLDSATKRKVLDRVNLEAYVDWVTL